MARPPRRAGHRPMHRAHSQPRKICLGSTSVVRLFIVRSTSLVPKGLGLRACPRGSLARWWGVAADPANTLSGPRVTLQQWVSEDPRVCKDHGVNSQAFEIPQESSGISLQDRWE